MKHALGRAFALSALATIGACSTGQSNTTPPIVSQAPSQASAKLQLAVGTVNFSGIASGINVLETFRGANGFSAVPINTATLSGPPGFTAPAGSSDPGSGAVQIPLGSSHNAFIIGNAGSGTILASADGFGIGPPSSSIAGQNIYPFQPQFADAAGLQAAGLFPGGAMPIYAGPPAYPPAIMVPSALSAQHLIPSGWAEGFYLVALSAAPASGDYTLTVQYTANSATVVTQASAHLANQTLPLFNPPQLTSTGNGGASVTVALPPGVTEAIVNVLDTNVLTTCATAVANTTLVFRAGAAPTQTIPSNLGTAGAPTFCSGDTLLAQAFGFDYDDVGLGPPANVSPAPTLPAQADVTVSFPSPAQE